MWGWWGMPAAVEAAYERQSHLSNWTDPHCITSRELPHTFSSTEPTGHHYLRYHILPYSLHPILFLHVGRAH